MSGFEVTELPPASNPGAGSPAPDFSRPLVTGEFWEDVSFSTLATDGPVVLVFYPMDGTGNAKYTWIELRERGWDTADGGATVVGLSISTPYEHKAFIDRHNLPYALYSDPGNGVARRYGVTHDHDGMAGLVGARPAVFVVDETLTVQYAWAAEEWPELPPFDRVEQAVDHV